VQPAHYREKLNYSPNIPAIPAKQTPKLTFLEAASRRKHISIEKPPLGHNGNKDNNDKRQVHIQPQPDTNSTPKLSTRAVSMSTPRKFSSKRTPARRTLSDKTAEANTNTDDTNQSPRRSERARVQPVELWVNKQVPATTTKTVEKRLVPTQKELELERSSPRKRQRTSKSAKTKHSIQMPAVVGPKVVEQLLKEVQQLKDQVNSLTEKIEKSTQFWEAHAGNMDRRVIIMEGSPEF
jgi:hypothetical protein